MVDCPFCESYQNESSGSVIAHAVGKSDENHKGISFQAAQTAVEASDADTAQGTEPDTEAIDDKAQTTDGESAFDAPRADDGVTSMATKIEPDETPLKPGQQIDALNGDTYETENGDTLSEEGIAVTENQVLETPDGSYVRTEEGDRL